MQFWYWFVFNKSVHANCKSNKCEIASYQKLVRSSTNVPRFSESIFFVYLTTLIEESSESYNGYHLFVSTKRIVRDFRKPPKESGDNNSN